MVMECILQKTQTIQLGMLEVLLGIDTCTWPKSSLESTLPDIKALKYHRKDTIQ